jgi:hypothetical protein
MYHIQKEHQIQDSTEVIFYEGNYQWTTEYENRKTYKLKKDATAELYEFGGIVVSDK